jgi:FKBP-type peptidyl-prolyl cis-trans isomerase FkpA
VYFYTKFPEAQFLFFQTKTNMKRTALFSFILFLITIAYSSCSENIYMDWKLQNERWYASLEDSIKNDSAFFKTSSGLYYKKIFQGDPQRPVRTHSYIYATYTGKLVDGSTFDSGTDASLGQIPGLVPGFQEGVKKMNVGGHYILYIPSKIGYDTTSTNSLIPPYSTLIFDVNLTDVVNN